MKNQIFEHPLGHHTSIVDGKTVRVCQLCGVQLGEDEPDPCEDTFACNQRQIDREDD